MADDISTFEADGLAEVRSLPATAAFSAKHWPSNNRHFLLICGPFGPFTRHLGRRLREAGARCSRVILNGGDIYDWGLSNAKMYAGHQNGFADWVARVIERDAVTDVIIYGDANPFCAGAAQVARDTGLNVHVLEQGYFRPFWITLERDGVNGNSRLPRDPNAYRRAAEGLPAPDETWLPPLTPPAVRNLSFYHLALWLATPAFPRFRLPYVYSLPRQAAGHVGRYVTQKLTRKRRQRRLDDILNMDGQLFVGLLQRPGDSQLRLHSPFPTTADFIDKTIRSFARHAPAGSRLLFKSHPLDHGIEDHARSVARSAAAHGLGDRVFFTDVGDLAAMLPQVAGAVTANSTAGLSVIEHGAPVVALGKAIYDLPGLTHQGGLDTFWSRPEAPDPGLYDAFRRVVIARTQISGAYAIREGIDHAAPEVARRLLSS